MTYDAAAHEAWENRLLDDHTDPEDGETNEEYRDRKISEALDDMGEY